MLTLTRSARANISDSMLYCQSSLGHHTGQCAGITGFTAAATQIQLQHVKLLQTQMTQRSVNYCDQFPLDGTDTPTSHRRNSQVFFFLFLFINTRLSPHLGLKCFECRAFTHLPSFGGRIDHAGQLNSGAVKCKELNIN